jgi:hypothetical protein
MEPAFQHDHEPAYEHTRDAITVKRYQIEPSTEHTKHFGEPDIDTMAFVPGCLRV